MLVDIGYLAIGEFERCGYRASVSGGDGFINADGCIIKIYNADFRHLGFVVLGDNSVLVVVFGSFAVDDDDYFEFDYTEFKLSDLVNYFSR